MNRKEAVIAPPAPETAAPSAEHAALALREAAVLMAPVAQWLLRSGVSYGAFADALKAVFVDAAGSELERAGAQTTFSALSMLSGVHRKDVRAIQDEPRTLSSGNLRSIPLSSQVYTRWLTSRRYRLRDGQPKPLPRNGPGVTFESLAREISQDVHPRTVLDELLRLRLVQLDKTDTVVPVVSSFTPSQRLDELSALFAANAADHLAAAVRNLTLQEPPLLEQSVFADGLSAESIAILHGKARAAWAKAFKTMVDEATQRVNVDATGDSPATCRMRFGVYFYNEDQAPGHPKGQAATPVATPSRPSLRPRVRRTP